MHFDSELSTAPRRSYN